MSDHRPHTILGPSIPGRELRVLGQVDPNCGPPDPPVQAAVDRARAIAREVLAPSAAARRAYLESRR